MKKKVPSATLPPIEAKPAETLTPDAASKVERAIVSNILQKIQKGGTPTTRQSEMLRQFFNETASGGKLGVVWVRAYPELGAALGCHRASFPRWRRLYDDCPKPRSDGWHNVDQWREWLNAHPQVKAASEIGVEKQQLELEEIRQKVRKAILQNNIREQQFTSNDVFVDWISRIVGEAKGLLRQKFEFELPAYTAHQESAVIRLLNKRAIDEICARLGELTREQTKNH